LESSEVSANAGERKPKAKIKAMKRVKKGRIFFIRTFLPLAILRVYFLYSDAGAD
jgi:hypothetical protein